MIVRDTRQDVVSPWNLPNTITVTRVLFAPACLILMLIDGGQDGPLRFVAAALFIVGMATDGVDGHIARSRGLITDFGKIADPIADKALVGSALVGLSLLGELPWWITGLILVREIGLTVFRLLALRSRVIPASRAGKIKTVVQTLAISLYLMPLWLFAGGWIHAMNFWIMLLAVVLTVGSGAVYLYEAWLFNRSAKQVVEASPADPDDTPAKNVIG